MKRKLLLVNLIVILSVAVKAQYVNIPDSNFRNYLITKYPSCFNAAKQMDTTCTAIVNETQLMANNTNFTSIDGIEYFDNLQDLNVESNKISSISKFPLNLKIFLCSNNPNLHSLPQLPSGLQKLVVGTKSGSFTYFTLPLVLPSSLHYLQCYAYFSVLPALPNTIDTLSLNGGSFSSLPNTLPTNLIFLSVSHNESLNSIPALPSTLNFLDLTLCSKVSALPTLPSGLEYLAITFDSLITSLPTLPSNLKNFNCNACYKLPISNLSLPSQLIQFSCQNCKTNALPILPNSLKYLFAGSNFIQNLPQNLPTSLKNLSCSYNLISTLPDLPNSLTSLDCYKNTITCLPKLPSSLQYLRIDTSFIKCIPNKPFSLSTILNENGINVTNSMPVCNATNNPNQCRAFPTVIGSMFYDNNSSGVKDANEPYKAFGLVYNSNTNYAFTNNNGNYTLGFDNIGTYNITFIPPPFYTAVPPIATVTFNSYDSTIVLPDVALQPTTTIDSLAIVATPILDRARPGWEFPYFVAYANVGTTTLSPNINLAYDNNYLVYDSCSNPLVTNSGSNLNLLYPNMPAGQWGYHLGYFRVKPTATLGDTLKATASISCPTTASVFDLPNTIITGAFDPNEKEATPTLTPVQVGFGKPINYTIYFQNTGNDTAFNVVVADSLSALLQANTLQVISSSHNCKASVKNGVAYFEFLNIKLPDSNVSELKSHGFVRFTVKPKTTLTNGTNIYNKAYIYFDYNAAIVTNTAVTQIKNSVITPVVLKNYSVELTKDNVLNKWETANEINVFYYKVERSDNGKDFKVIGTVKANNGVNNEYQFKDEQVINGKWQVLYYRVVAVDYDNRLTYSATKTVQLRNNSSVSVFPNPANDVVHIECSEGIKEVRLFNHLGQEVNSRTTTTNTTTSQTIDIKQLSKGLYILKVISTGGKMYNEKLIVK